MRRPGAGRPLPLALLAPLALVPLAAHGCAHARQPAPAVAQAASALGSYSATLRVDLRGADLRGRGRVLLAFARPDRLRVEVPGPGGLRVLAVARGGTLWAVFPGEAAWFEGPAESEVMRDLLGLALSPAELMDLLLGRAGASLTDYEARWDARLPRRVKARLPDGSRVSLAVEGVEAPASLPEAAFAEPAHAGYRRVDAVEARALWAGR